MILESTMHPWSVPLLSFLWSLKLYVDIVWSFWICFLFGPINIFSFLLDSASFNHLWPRVWRRKFSYPALQITIQQFVFHHHLIVVNIHYLLQWTFSQYHWVVLFPSQKHVPFKRNITYISSYLISWATMRFSYSYDFFPLFLAAPVYTVIHSLITSLTSLCHY